MRKIILAMCCLSLFACDNQEKKEKQPQEIKAEVKQFLEAYNKTYQQLLKISSEAEWVLNTRITEGDTLASYAARGANEKFAEFTGSRENIDKSREFLEQKQHLTNLEIKQLEKILYEAGANPQTATDIVKEKIKADAKQTEDLFGFNFMIDGKPVSANEIDRVLGESENLDERLAAWEASKEVGKVLKPGLANLRDLRNKSVQNLGYDDYFAYQVSDYGMTSDEMMQLCRKLVNDVWPLYRELHTWARYSLAEKYKQEVPEMLPAHWLPDRWGQDWMGMVNVDGVNLDEQLSEKSAEWIVEQGEEFYTSLGFDELPKTFYDRSSLYPLPEGDAGAVGAAHHARFHGHHARQWG